MRKLIALRSGVVAAALLAVLALAAVPVRAQDYPNRPITLIVPFPPGGSTTIVGRIIADKMSEVLGQSIVVDNRGGAGGTIGSRTVAKSAGDGYTILLGYTGTLAIGPSLYGNVGYDPRTDFEPIGRIGTAPNTLVVHPSFPVHSVPELIAYAKANPGKVNIGSFGTGTTSHVAGELFKMTAGIDMTHVPYRGGAPLMTDLIGGQVQVAFDVLTGALSHIKSGDIRALAMAGATRYEGLPDVPTIGETMPLFVANSWCGVGVPRGTPPEIVARLNREINAGMRDSAVIKRLTALATTPMFFTPDEFGSYIGAEIEKWRKVVRAANIKVQ